MRIEWTRTEEALLEEAVIHGSTRPQVALLLRKDEQEVQRKAHELGLVESPPLAMR
jgi:hypothetical protein